MQHAPRPGLSEEVAALIRQSEQANAALMLGDIERYRDLVSHSDDYTLMSPFGGTPTHGRQITSERWEEIGRFFRNGSLTQELVQSYATADMVVLVTIEQALVEVGGLPAQPWSLRVTLVYRREGSGWCLAHRHADPLANAITLEAAAALAQGPKTRAAPGHGGDANQGTSSMRV